MNQGIEDNQLNLAHYWHLIRNRIWRIISLTVLVTILASILVNSMTPIYRSTAVLLLEPEQAKAISMEDMFNVNTRGSTYFNTQREIMRSKQMLAQVVDVMQLDQAPEFRADKKEQEPSWIKSLLQSEEISRIKLLLKFGEESSEPSAAERQQALIASIKNILKVKAVKGTKLIEISFESKSAQMAADVANTLAEVYIRDSLESRIEMTRQASSWMRERTTSLKLQLAKAESRLQAFIEREGLVNLGEGVESLTSQELSELSNRSLTARAKVSELRQRYGPKHPKLIAAKSELAQAERATRSGKSKIRSLGRKGVKLKELKHEVESTRQLYETFLNRVKETDESGTLKTATARMIDPAIAALAPIKPKKKRIIIIAFILTLLAGIGLVFLLDMLDTTIRSVEQVEKKLNRPMLGLLPYLKLKSKERSEVLKQMTSGDNSQFTECVRTIRTGIMLSAIDNPHKILLVTSSIPGEGKSTVAANLAIAMGKMERVLLIDADLRRPTVSKNFGMQTKKPGLSELVAGTAGFKDCISHDDDYGIDVMHAGVIPPNPLELLASNRFKAVLDALEKHYDRVILDSTPVQAVSDSLVLSQHVRGVVYVVKSDATSEHLIKRCLEQLARVDAPVIGIVLNQVDVKKKGKYGYGYGYGGYYDYYGYSSKNSS